MHTDLIARRPAARRPLSLDRIAGNAAIAIGLAAFVAVPGRWLLSLLPF